MSTPPPEVTFISPLTESERLEGETAERHDLIRDIITRSAGGVIKNWFGAEKLFDLRDYKPEDAAPEEILLADIVKEGSLEAMNGLSDFSARWPGRVIFIHDENGAMGRGLSKVELGEKSLRFLRESNIRSVLPGLLTEP